MWRPAVFLRPADKAYWYRVFSCFRVAGACFPGAWIWQAPGCRHPFSCAMGSASSDLACLRELLEGLLGTFGGPSGAFWGSSGGAWTHQNFDPLGHQLFQALRGAGIGSRRCLRELLEGPPGAFWGPRGPPWGVLGHVFRGRARFGARRAMLLLPVARVWAPVLWVWYGMVWFDKDKNVCPAGFT